MVQEQQGQQNQPQQPGTTNTFTGGMVKDPIDLFKKGDTYTHARNMTTFLPDGQLGGRSAEPSNEMSALVTYTIIGSIFLGDGDWIVFSTDNTLSEIGIFSDNNNSYTVLMNDAATLAASKPGLNFKTSNLITGASRRGYDCGFDVYWSDGGLNPDRILNTATCPWTIGAVTTPKTFPNPWVQNCITSAGCVICNNTDVLDIEQLRLAPLMSVPCLKLSKHAGPGQLLNGSYQVCVAFAVNSIKCTDYIAFSDVISLWTHVGQGNAFDVTISNIDDQTKLHFTEMEVVVISMVNQQIQAKRLGIYSTALGSLTIDNIDLTLPNIPIEKLPLSSPAIVSSDAIFSISNYLTRVGPKERPDFNYQLRANQIRTWWTAVMQDEDYYHNGGTSKGMNVGYLRGEVYSFYIRWTYNTGDKSASYHIPARNLPSTAGPSLFTAGFPSSVDDGTVIAYGRTGVYRSNEIYPDHSPAVWGPLCGKNIMHHRFPDQASFSLSAGTIMSHFNPLSVPPTGSSIKSKISILGVFFDNIQPPVDNNGVIIPDITGYEILRSTRDGHQSIIAKGMVNHMRGYKKADNTEGLYQNYPYDDLTPDRYLTSSQTIGSIGGTVDGWQGNELDIVKDDVISFHSPDTVFSSPYLGIGDLELVEAVAGKSVGSFCQAYKHPKFKLLTDLASYFSGMIGSLVALSNLVQSVSGSNFGLAATEDVPLTIPFSYNSIPEGNVAGTSTVALIEYYTVASAASLVSLAMFPITTKTVQAQLMNVINGLIPAKQYAWQYNSHGYYDTPVATRKASFQINDYQYIKGNIQSFAGYDINNLYRNNYVAIKLDNNIPDFPLPYSKGGAAGSNVFWQGLGTGFGSAVPGPDHSRFTLAQAPSSPYGPGDRDPLGPFESSIVSWYAAYKVPQLSQYGQIDSTKQVPIGCVQQVDIYSASPFISPVLFGGDTYINRYTEKNPFMFFNDWLVNTPDDFQYNYTNYENVPYPRYWINNSKIYYDFWQYASKNWHLDELASTATVPFGPLSILTSKFYVESGYFYLFNNGVRDFFVESSVNVGYRDWEDEISKRFYDPYGFQNTDYLFRADIIKSDIFYKYDYSLSAGKFINQFISWGSCLRRDYDPILAYTCFSYYPRRVAYSLPQEEEQMQDNWRIFLPNNYKDFNDRVYVIKDLHKTGALFLMENSSPVMFAGVETIPSKSATEYTVGTGLLFSQTLQSLNNIDDAYEYASCQSRQGVINTKHGAFWVSQDTGKIFNLKGGQIADLGVECGINYHLINYLPSQLVQQYPSFSLKDNPVAGVGCQLVYDPVHEILYICKKDYKVINPSLVTLVNNTFVYRDTVTGVSIKLNIGDPAYFENASWTLSYDCNSRRFISWHDWHPSHVVPSKLGFFTSNGLSGRLWRHNTSLQSFANFYGIDYPVEIEYFTNTQVTETILQNIEWLLESYQYAPNGVDKFLNYDQSFDYFMVYNKEQNSTLQNMLLKPWDNPYAALNYPNWLGPTRQILYQKVENKYRVNDFYDYTADRGQFSLANTPMLTTNSNGYTFSTNTPYFNLLKPWNQQKRVRYTGTRIFMRKTKLGKNSLTIRYASTKNQYSAR
jgi:hypothetical protein